MPRRFRACRCQTATASFPIQDPNCSSSVPTRYCCPAVDQIGSLPAHARPGPRHVGAGPLGPYRWIANVCTMRCTSSIEIACIPSGSSALPPVPADRPPYGSNWIYLLKLDATRIRLEPVTRRKATVARIWRNSRPGVRLNEHLEQPDGWIALSVRPAGQSSRDLARPAVRREADED